MQDTAGTWLMTALTTSPLLIALMQTAASLPVLFLGLPAGATADIFDRRRLLIFWQAWMLATVALLSLLTMLDVISPAVLLVLTFLLNIGSAMNNPAWQAIVPELVPRSELPDAISLNSAGFNLARAVGPALGGLTVAAFVSPQVGAAVVFLLNSASFLAVIFVLYVWKRTPIFKSALPAERMFGSMRSGVRYVRHSPPLLAILLRTLLFTVFASAVWALLAVVAQQDLHAGAMAYGVLNGCLGIGAVIGAMLLPRLRRVVPAEWLLAAAGLIFSGTLATLALTRSVPLIVFWLIAAGCAWTSTTSTLNIAVQLSVPAWVQARALGTYQMIFAERNEVAPAAGSVGLDRRRRLQPDFAARRRRRNADRRAYRPPVPAAARRAARSVSAPRLRQAAAARRAARAGRGARHDPDRIPDPPGRQGGVHLRHTQYALPPHARWRHPLGSLSGHGAA